MLRHPSSRSSFDASSRHGAARYVASVGIFVLAGIALIGCDDILKDSTFRLWCGDGLCEWKTEQGSLRKAPTWHKEDYGVEFVDTPTVISQESTAAPRCIQFTTVADVDPKSQFTIGLDFNRDGSIDYEQPIAATGFREAKSIISAPNVAYDGLRIVLSKKGAGRAVLAEMRAQAVDGCSAPPVELRDQPLGAACAADTSCSTGVCCDGLCSDCCSKEMTLTPFDSASTARDVACADDATCEVRPPFPFQAPAQCAPGKGTRGAGGACIGNDDCASGVCEGAIFRGTRADGEPCTASRPPAVDGSEKLTVDGCSVHAMRGGLCK